LAVFNVMPLITGDIVNVLPDAPLRAFTCSDAVRPTEVVIVETLPSPTREIPGLTTTVTGIEVVAPSESVAVMVS
jgi:hypothetical protein